jgi:tRNA uridine 5-carboxymethylaminomethyl modification enzyme
LNYGLVKSTRAAAFAEKMERLNFAREQLKQMTTTPNEAAAKGLPVNQDGVSRSLFDLLGYPSISWQDLTAHWPALNVIDQKTAEIVGIDAQYAVYLDRQLKDIASFRRDEALEIPSEFDFDGLAGLSTELKTKLKKQQPKSLGAAARLEGMTPAATTLILAHLKKRSRKTA